MSKTEGQEKIANPIVRRLLTPEEVNAVAGGETIGDRRHCQHTKYNGGDYSQHCTGVW